MLRKTNGGCGAAVRRVSLLLALSASLLGLAAAGAKDGTEVPFDIPASLLHRMNMAHAAAFERGTGITNAFDRFELWTFARKMGTVPRVFPRRPTSIHLKGWRRPVTRTRSPSAPLRDVDVALVDEAPGHAHEVALGAGGRGREGDPARPLPAAQDEAVVVLDEDLPEIGRRRRREKGACGEWENRQGQKHVEGEAKHGMIPKSGHHGTGIRPESQQPGDCPIG